VPGVVTGVFGGRLRMGHRRRPAEPDYHHADHEDPAQEVRAHCRLPPVRWAPYQVTVIVVVVASGVDGSRPEEAAAAAPVSGGPVSGSLSRRPGEVPTVGE
jgi:hypothetical protein